MRALFILISLLLVGCAEPLDKKIRYIHVIDYDGLDVSATIDVKYFDGKLRWRLFLIDHKNCWEDWNTGTKFQVNFRDIDKFVVHETGYISWGRYARTKDDRCQFVTDGMATMDASTYRLIDTANLSTVISK